MLLCLMPRTTFCRDKGKLLREVVESTKNLHQHLRFHAISGLHPERVTPDLAKMFAERTFAELYFEQSEEELELDGAHTNSVKPTCGKRGLIFLMETKPADSCGLDVRTNH